ncbi:ComEA family DNA-binding protein [Nonomuraea sp. NPDC049725]|uniref:ComEA family DNA-binding protein n=1 Tax=Nonomuraea sp. NPDC049725 TaxID=3154508 RepID=UPI00341A3008
MRTHDLAAERAIAETRLRSITTPARAPLLTGIPTSFQAFRASTRTGTAPTPHISPAPPTASARSPLLGSSALSDAAPGAGGAYVSGAAPISGPSPVSGLTAASGESILSKLAAASGMPRPALDPGRPGVRALFALAVVAVLVAGFFLWRSRPAPEPLPAPAPIASPPATTTPTTGKVTVHVAGKVRDPGVYTLPIGARVTDAITAAGGVRRGAPLGPVNLARRLVDGEQIMVGAPTAATAAAPAPEASVLDLNSATQDQLEQLPGVGEVLAARIAEYRSAHGGFTSIDQLRNVTGIGPRTFEEIKPKVRV